MIKVQKDLAKISKNLLHNLQDFDAWLSDSYSVVPLNLIVNMTIDFSTQQTEIHQTKQNIIKISGES